MLKDLINDSEQYQLNLLERILAFFLKLLTEGFKQNLESILPYFYRINNIVCEYTEKSCLYFDA